MRLLIIRHGDPNYELDTLTQRGWKEAELLSERLSKQSIQYFYLSPLGRAKDTASLTLKKMNASAIECDWLQEFPAEIDRPDRTDRKMIAWDWLPSDWMQEASHFYYDRWYQTGTMKGGNVGELYTNVTKKFDDLLAQHGYVRDGMLYRVEKSNRDTLAFFCHFGLECVLLSHLMNVSPMILWHHSCAAPSSVTSLFTEERREGTALFRMNYFGDISHLYAGNAVPSFAARFCETWDCWEERHD